MCPDTFEGHLTRRISSHEPTIADMKKACGFNAPEAQLLAYPRGIFANILQTYPAHPHGIPRHSTRFSATKPFSRGLQNTPDSGLQGYVHILERRGLFELTMSAVADIHVRHTAWHHRLHEV